LREKEKKTEEEVESTEEEVEKSAKASRPLLE
jgi:hypothetical protein